MKFSDEKNCDYKFLVDAMLGKLARFLRIFGYDTIYANDLENHFKIDPVPDEHLKKYAEENNRIIITKDHHFYHKTKYKSVYVEGEGIYNYLNQLKKKLDLHYEFDLNKARCSKCNSQLQKVSDKNSIKEFVLTETYRSYDEFYQCTSLDCKKVFWNGPHILHITNNLKKKLNTK
ncbi:MAG: DUF5615 family PIN-like protein [Promethearchaeota archaeon]